MSYYSKKYENSIDQYETGYMRRNKYHPYKKFRNNQRYSNYQNFENNPHKRFNYSQKLDELLYVRKEPVITHTEKQKIENKSTNSPTKENGLQASGEKHSLIVSNLSEHTINDEIWKIFKTAGPLKCCHLRWKNLGKPEVS